MCPFEFLPAAPRLHPPSELSLGSVTAVVGKGKESMCCLFRRLFEPAWLFVSVSANVDLLFQDLYSEKLSDALILYI